MEGCRAGENEGRTSIDILFELKYSTSLHYLSLGERGLAVCLFRAEGFHCGLERGKDERGEGENRFRG